MIGHILKYGPQTLTCPSKWFYDQCSAKVERKQGIKKTLEPVTGKITSKSVLFDLHAVNNYNRLRITWITWPFLFLEPTWETAKKERKWMNLTGQTRVK